MVKGLVLISKITFISFFFSYSSFGQTQLGVKAGASLSKIGNYEPFKFDFRLGWYAGCMTQIRISKKFFFRPELLYTIKGYKIPETNGRGQSIVSLKYLNIPLLVCFRQNERLSFFAGPELGYLTKATAKFEGNMIDVTSEFYKFDLGVDFGISYNLNQKMGIDLRYNYGFSRILKNYTVSSTTTVDRSGSNRALQLGVFYTIAKKN